MSRRCPECGKFRCECNARNRGTQPCPRCHGTGRVPIQQAPPPRERFETREPPTDPRYVAELMAGFRLRCAGVITQDEMNAEATDAELRAKHVEMAKARGLWKEPKGNEAREVVSRLAGAFGRVEVLQRDSAAPCVSPSRRGCSDKSEVMA